MRLLSSRIHGILDYLVSAFVIASPWVLGYTRGGAETYFPIAVGFFGIIYSLLTRYEFGLYPVISFRVHLYLDLLSGFLLAVSPWMLSFDAEVYVPHVIMGGIEILAMLLTDPSSAVKSRT